MSDLSTLVRPSIELTVAGGPLTLTPIRAGQLPAVMRGGYNLLASIAYSSAQGDSVDWPALLATSSDELLELVAVCSRMPRTWVDELEMDDLLRLLQALMEVNRDFFAGRVAPLIPQLRATLASMRETAGPTLSNGSSSTGTSGAKS